MTTRPTGRPTETADTTTGGRHRLTVTTPTSPATPSAPPAPTTPAAPPGTSPESRRETAPEVRREPVHYSDRARIASYRRTARRPPAAQAGALIVLLVGLSVVYAQWGLYPDNWQAQSDANWALLFMIVSTGAALRILMGNPGRHLVPVAAILLCGIGFVLRGFLIGGGEPAAVDAVEVVCGALLLLGGGLAAAWPALTPEPPAPVSPS